jgi:Ca2+-transporting ATPase
VRKLIVAETLGSATVICVDKTGTLTEGRMRVVRWELTDSERAIKAAALCNNLADPTETALWEKVRDSTHRDPQLIVEQNPRLAEIPFSPEKRSMSVTTQDGTWVKGAPEVILDRCSLNPKEQSHWQKLIDLWGREGLRIIALAYNQQFLGLIGLADPVRPEVKEALKLCQQAGIKVKVITGDHRATAEKVLQQLGFHLKPENIIEGHELKHLTTETVLFARTTPQQKLEIVKGLQAQGEVVVMMGDGVNDAPALKKAEIGIVVAEASEVAKETADMVLLDSNFGTIVKAIEEGRQMFANIKKTIVYLLSDSFTEVILIGGSILLGLPLPLLPAQILWVNLIEDGLLGTALAFDEEKGVMQEPPRLKNAPLLDREMKIIIFAVGLVTDLLLWGLFVYLWQKTHNLEHTRSIIFAALAVDSLFCVFSCRGLHRNIWEHSPFANRFLVLAVFLSLVLLLTSLHLPIFQFILGTEALRFHEWLWVLSLGVINVLGIETVKRILLKANER